MVKVSKQMLADFITYPTADELHFDDMSKVYDVINRDSDTLVVTVGDSWSYGLDLPDRLTQVYGSIVAKELSADWLNIAAPGQGNFWIVTRFEEIIRLLSHLDYSKIYVVCVFTEIGRSMISHLDGFMNYRKWLTNYTGTDLYNDFLKFINESCVARLVKLASIDSRITLRIGSTWPDPLGLDDPHCFDKTWLDIIRLHHPLPLDHVCYSAMHGLFHVKRAESFFPDSNEFMEWYIQAIEAGTKRLDFMRNNPDQFINFHTRAPQHQQWADYVVDCLKESK